MNKSSHPLMHLLVLLAMVLLMLLISSVLVYLLFPQGIIGGRLTDFYVSQTLTQVCVFALPVLMVALRYYRAEAIAYFRLDLGKRSWGMALWAVAVMLLLIPIVDCLTVWNDGWQLGAFGERMRAIQNQSEQLLAQVINNPSAGALIGNLVVVALVPAVCEELLFRSGIQNLLHRWSGNAHIAVWGAAIIFSIAHGELFAFVPRLLMGAALGYLYIYSGTLLANVSAHFINNALVVLFYWLYANNLTSFCPDEPLGIGWGLAVASAIAAIGLLAWEIVRARKRNGTQLNHQV